MPVNVPAADREILCRYLLGQTSAPEADEVEDRFAGDDNYFALYEEVERALVSDYAAGLLEPLNAALFEKNYLVTPERRERVTVVRALLRVRSSELNQSARARPIKVISFALATSTVMAIGAILILWPQRGSLNKSAVIAQRQRTPATIDQPTVSEAAPVPSVRVPQSGHEAKATTVRGAAPVITAPLPSTSPKQTEDTPPQGPVLAESKPPTSRSHAITTSGVSRGGTSAIPFSDKIADQPEPPTNPTLDADTIAAVRSKLLDKYILTKPTPRLDGIESAGSEFILKKENLVMSPVGAHDLIPNAYKDGRIAQKAVVGRLFSYLPGASRTNSIDRETRTFISGEKVQVTDISVTERAVVFRLLTQDWSNLWYKGTLSFPLPKEGEVSADQVEKMVSEVFDVKPPENTNATRQQKTPVEPVQPRVITLGQTPDQVIATFGQPLKIITFSSGKQIFYYRDFRVTFTDNKVKDFQ